MAVGPVVATARDVNPEVLAIGGFHDELVKVAMAFNEVKPLASSLHIGVPLVIIPSGITG